MVPTSFFHQPTQHFLSHHWRTFTATIQEVLQLFSCFKLKRPDKKRSKDQNMEVTSKTFTTSHYFAKYLTSETLVNVQLSDSHF